MDNNNWRPTQGGAEPAIDTGDWRTQLQNESRQRIVNKIMDTLKRHLPFSGQEGLQELKKIAIRFEEKIYTAATSQSDYLRKISLKMLTMESKSQNTMANSLPSNSASTNPADAGSLGMQSQIGNQGPLLPVTKGANQGQPRQQILNQNIQNNISTTALQGSSCLTSAMAGGGGLPQTSMPSVGQNINLQNMQTISGVSQNSVANSMGQGVSANMYAANTQRQMQGRQQVLTQQQPQNPQQILYQQQLQQQLRQKYPQGNIQNTHMQQQNLLQSSQQSVMQPNVQQNQQSSVQQSQSMLQQNQQSVLRQHTHLQSQSMLPQQPQQQLLGQQPNSTSMHPNQLLGQQNSMSEMQQQRQLGQQNNISNLQQQPQQQLMGQQQLGPQGNVSGLQQQQMLVTQSGNSSMQNNNQHPALMMQQTKVPMPPQQNQQNSTALLPSQGQHSQSQMPQDQLMPQILSQPGQLQQQQNQLQRDMQQRLQSSGPLLPPQNMIDQKQMLFQAQRTMPEAPSSSLDSTAQTGNANAGDWQEEIYQKILTMKEAYLPELNEMYMKIAGKLQQHDTLSQQPKNEQVEKLKMFKQMLERIMTFLQVPKNNILPTFKDKLGAYEKQIINILNSNRPRKPGSSMQQPQQFPPPHMHQQQQSQISQVQSHENLISSQVESMNLQGSVNPWQQNNVTSLQHNSLSSLSGGQNASQSLMNPLQSNSKIDSSQGNSLNTLPQAAVGSMPQSVSAPQQPNSNLPQHQQLKQQEQQMLHNQLKQKYQQHHMQQQMIQKQQLQQQQQQQILQQKLQQNAQAQQMPQNHQMNDMDMKMKQQLGVNGGGFQQNQRSMYHHQQLRSGSQYPNSSPQLPQAASPQIPFQHPSPQIDQKNVLPSLTKTGTPLQSANSPFIVPSPPTPLAPSPMQGDPEKAISGVSALPSTGAGGHQQASAVVTPAQSLAIGTPGISASPLLAESTSPDGTLGNMSTVVFGMSSATEQPLDRLIKAVKSMSPNALSAAVNDIGSVVGMIDRVAGSAPGNGSRAAVGEDLVAMTKCRLQARNFISQEANGGTRKIRRFTSAMPLNVASSAGSIKDSIKHLTGTETADVGSTATSNIKRPRVEASHSLLEEIREINQRLIDTVVDVSDEDVDATAAAAAAVAEGGNGTVIKCSYCAVALSPRLKSRYASGQMSTIQPLRLLVPTNYPGSSPILLDKFPVEVSKEYEDLSSKTKTRFSRSLRNLSEPMSIGEIARTWDACARAVILEYAQQSGGGSFSSKYGTWDNCLSAA